MEDVVGARLNRHRILSVRFKAVDIVMQCVAVDVEDSWMLGSIAWHDRDPECRAT